MMFQPIAGSVLRRRDESPSPLWFVVSDGEDLMLATGSAADPWPLIPPEGLDDEEWTVAMVPGSPKTVHDATYREVLKERRTADPDLDARVKASQNERQARHRAARGGS